jgi:hypothetical protein
LDFDCHSIFIISIKNIFIKKLTFHEASSFQNINANFFEKKVKNKCVGGQKVSTISISCLESSNGLDFTWIFL